MLRTNITNGTNRAGRANITNQAKRTATNIIEQHRTTQNNIQQYSLKQAIITTRRPHRINRTTREKYTSLKERWRVVQIGQIDGLEQIQQTEPMEQVE